ncbi:MAG: hypothetical protein HY308_07260 [Gammaproteobacteria bacterium]|nr:hypothetical protein [Gammaproteobacteria bacterium]
MDFVLAHLCFFDPQNELERKQSPQAVGEPKREQRLFCARCRHLITHDDHRVAIHSGHTHTCTNPLGITFHIACFRQALGCNVFGIPTAADSWFPGYFWRIAACAKCEAHLGWEFRSMTDEFYGLIVDRLTSAGAA